MNATYYFNICYQILEGILSEWNFWLIIIPKHQPLFIFLEMFAYIHENLHIHTCTRNTSTEMRTYDNQCSANGRVRDLA